MKRKVFVLVLVVVLILSLVGGCANAQKDATLYQVSTLQALIAGSYDGEVTAKQLAQYGDTGLGTFDGLDGEMIVLDGKVYKARVDGTVAEVPEDETIPFANVAYILNDHEIEISFEGGYEGLKAALNEQFPEQNMPVLFCISGEFTDIDYRSVPEQDKPYPPLTEVVKEQTIFDKDNIKGTLVGFRFPEYLNDMNATGFHLHFISDDRQDAGHLLEVKSGRVTVKAQALDSFYVVFPSNVKDIDMSADEDDVKAVEKVDK